MKRNRFGINMDEGVALTTLEEFDRLFVDTESDTKESLDEWLRTGDRPMILFAFGIDKFEPGSTAYFALTDILQTLSAYKTLFEVNAVHLFYGHLLYDGSGMGKMEKIIINPLRGEQIREMLVKRLGRYAKTYRDDVALLAGYSWGIPRQALRLLDSFLAVQNRLPNKKKTLMSIPLNLSGIFP